MTVQTRQLRVTVTGARLDVVIDRPQARNALSLETLHELEMVFTRFADVPDLNVAVLTGAGDRAFAAGGDLKELNHHRSEAQAGALFDAGCAALDAVRRFPLPVVAALNGVALGGGAELAMACDFRLAAVHAAIGFVQAQLAITTGFAGIADLQAAVGPRKAMGMMLSARVFKAPEAEAQGLFDAVAGESEPLEALVSRFLAPILERPPALVRDIKAVARAGRDPQRRAAIAEEERARFIRAWMSEEHWAAAERLLARRS
ncbi:enoyl-CoA hydratase/isomerase family protein [Xanthobacter autotrophicus]|uniref:enoyl-CoA hydratase/isomerase family protein n=1 Tax=Xanthobacter autotrophicus TaxID=280 RepID=UPI003728289E